MRIMGGENYGLSPLKAVLQVGSAPANRIHWPRIDGLFLVRAIVVTRDVTAVRAGVNDLRVRRIGGDISAFAATYGIPVRTIDGAIRPGVGNSHRAVVL